MFADDSNFTRALMKTYRTLVRHRFTTLLEISGGNRMFDRVQHTALESFDKETLSQVYSTWDSKFKSLYTFSFGEHKLNPTLIRNISADIYIPEDVK